MKLTMTSVAFAGLLLGTTLAQAATLATFAGTVYDVSGDGRTAVFNAGSSIGLYSLATGTTTTIGGVAIANSLAAGTLAISKDGSKVLGAVHNTSLNAYEPAVFDIGSSTWTAAGNLGAKVGSISAGGFAMSSDGRYVAGNAYKSVTVGTTTTIVSRAVVTDMQTGSIMDVSDPTGPTDRGRINGISTDGSVMVGQYTTSNIGSIWTRQPDGSYLRMKPHLEGSTANLQAVIAVSDNGKWAVGGSGNRSDINLIDTATGIATPIPKLPLLDAVGRATATPTAISDDGMTMVGTHQIGTQNFDTNHGFIWTAAGGTQDLDTYFAGFGIDLGNQYNFVSAVSMSDDGKTIVGIANDNITHQPVGFVVSVATPVPEPSSYAMLAAGLGVLAWVARRRRGQAF